MIFGYTQIGGTKEDILLQHNEIVNYAAARKYMLSEVLSAADVALLDNNFHKGDILIVRDMAYLGHTLNQIRDAVQKFVSCGITLISAQDNRRIIPGSEAESLLRGFDLALDIRNKLLSRTTTQALAERKAAGVVLGRPQTAKIKKRLDGREAEISQLLAEGLSKAEIARRLNVSRVTLYKFIRKNQQKDKI